MKPHYTIILLILSNIFMTIAWYGHLKLSKLPTFSSLSLIWIILLSWGVAFLSIVFKFLQTDMALWKMVARLIYGS